MAGGPRVQKGAQISDSFTCSFGSKDFRQTGFVQNIAKGGAVLWETYSQASVFVPSSTNELEDHCANLHVSYPPASRKLFKTKVTCRRLHHLSS